MEKTLTLKKDKMKCSMLILLLTFSLPNLYSQKSVYSKDNKKKSYQSEEVELKLKKSSDTILIARLAGHEMGMQLLPLIPAAVDFGFSLTTKILEERMKKYSGEYVVSSSYLEAGERSVPDIEFIRHVDGEVSLKVSLKAKKIKKVEGYVYYVELIDLGFSKAKTTNKSRLLDYTIEVVPVFYVGKELKTQEIRPIMITSVPFGENKFDELKYRTSIIPLPEGGILTELSLKIVETNPAKINQTRMLEVFNAVNETSMNLVKIVVEAINSPKEETEEDDGIDPDTSVGN